MLLGGKIVVGINTNTSQTISESIKSETLLIVVNQLTTVITVTYSTHNTVTISLIYFPLL